MTDRKQYKHKNIYNAVSVRTHTINWNCLKPTFIAFKQAMTIQFMHMYVCKRFPMRTKRVWSKHLNGMAARSCVATKSVNSLFNTFLSWSANGILDSALSKWLCMFAPMAVASALWRLLHLQAHRDTSFKLLPILQGQNK